MTATVTAFRLLSENDKEGALLSAVRNANGNTASGTAFVISLDDILAIPGCPLAYWVTPGIRQVFRRFPVFENQDAGRTTRCGLGTLDDFRFLRLNWEVSGDLALWTTYYNGGIYSPFYDQVTLVVRWAAGGKEVKVFVEQKVGSASRKVQGEDRYLVQGFVFPRRTKALAPKVMPSGGIFSTGGQAGFAPSDELLASIALLSSKVCSYLIAIAQGRTGDAAQFEVGLIKRLPWPLNNVERVMLGGLARRAWSLKRSLDTGTETSHAFILPALLQVNGIDVSARAAAWFERVRMANARLADIQIEIDERCFALYGIDGADRCAIAERFGFKGAEEGVSDCPSDSEVDDADEEKDSIDAVTALASGLLSWAIGVAFGRFDIRLATGARSLPTEPEPFDPLPVCSPAMLRGDDSRPLPRVLPEYPVDLAEVGMFFDDPGHGQDFPTAVHRVFEVAFGADADRWWDDVAGLVEPQSRDIRAWLVHSSFEYHLKRYSRSRRKAPVVWQLGTPSGCYSIWLNAHRTTRDSFFQIQNDVVAPKLAHEERQLASLIQNSGGNPTVLERKAIATKESVVDELRAMLDEVRRVAPLWNPNLDDGVVLTMTPLWRLVPQCKPWQKELKAKWEELVEGKYDWAYLAMHLWPERVVPKCATDRSLAIAHGVEDVFWVERDDGKWIARKVPTCPMEDMVRDRTSSSVKAALRALIEAPGVSDSKRSKRGKSNG